MLDVRLKFELLVSWYLYLRGEIPLDTLGTVFGERSSVDHPVTDGSTEAIERHTALLVWYFDANPKQRARRSCNML